MKRPFLKILFAALGLCLLTQTSLRAEDITNDDCLACHDGGEPAVDPQEFAASVHHELNCVDCHTSISETPHQENVEPVDCSMCHADQQDIFAQSVHGQALANNDPLAPRCQNCHGQHGILPVKDPNSAVAPLKIPFVCGSCHQEGTEVQQQRPVHQDHILENYTESIHGEGLLKKGLSVSATCVSCHSAHDILPAADPRSSISKKNIVATCLHCHSGIETVHQKVIKSELWEKTPHVIPLCVDCHQPHKARKIFYDQGVASRDCLTCHGQETLTSSKGASLFVNPDDLKHSVHAGVSCAQCHVEVTPSQERACSTIKNKVNCALCHNKQVEQYQSSTHGQLWNLRDTNAPGCVDCHGTHSILPKTNVASTTYPTNVPKLCSTCHQEDGQAAMRILNGEDVTKHYSESIHGKGLIESGLTVTATCTSCHTAHGELPPSNPASTVNRDNIAATCSQCHQGVYEKYLRGVHAPKNGHTDEKLPVCSDCHSAHTINRTDADGFKMEIMNVCGKCHEDIAETYFETFHGKVSKLGYAKTAKCHDCHGSHEILPAYDPNSTLNRDHIVDTCAQCHPGATKRFAGYLTHATHHDPQKYPWIFWTFWAMTGLLVFTFFISGLHTLLWLPRSFKMRRAHPPKPHTSGEKQYVRFPLLYRVMHGLMIISFLTLAITGMTLKFSYTQWATFLSHLLGGFETSAFIHRCAAVLMFGLFFTHLWDLFRRKTQESKTWKDMIFGANSMLFNKKDGQDFVATIKWYLGKGPYPRYGRWTYWEKFDYLAVFWGIAVIGTSGLILWFPQLFTHFLPGWAINVATIIHSDEALLATGFIFTIHFFNTHFRPEKFPMDKVIFTGRTTLEELKRERPEEYQALVDKNQLEKHLADPLPERPVRIVTTFAWIALTIGVIIIISIIYTMLFVYK